MSYKKAMKWNKRHPKGTKQTVIAHTNSGFWPTSAFIQRYLKYVENCKTNQQQPLEIEAYYQTLLK